jgi:hypothetical protein
MMFVTSSPWKPTSVYLVASTRINGAFISLERTRNISVLPLPERPLTKMLLGLIASLSSSSAILWAANLFLIA